MPNWVYNTLVVTPQSGKRLELESFLREMEAPRPEAVTENYVPTGELVMSERGFSFWNAVAPPADKWDEYFGRKGFIDGKQVGDTEYNWYNWNLDNWGCKWDAGNGDVDWLDDTTLRITFDTPWSMPEHFAVKLAEQYPNLEISWCYEEEQGWGGEVTLINGEMIVDEEWDIPDSHADYTKRGNECRCEWGDDLENWFDDCPRPLQAVEQ